MWRNYLTVALRALARSRTSAVINIAGLGLGIAACVAIFLFVRWETSFDAALPGADRAFQLQQTNTNADNDFGPGTQMTSFASGRALAKDFPQFDRVVYVGKGQPAVIQDGQATTAENFVYVDGPLFDVLRLPFLRGDRRTALAAPGSLVLTASEAAKRFGTADPLGRTLTLIASGKTTDYRVTGVVADPVHSHLALSMIARYDPVAAYGVDSPFLTGWMPKNGWVYARLRPGARIDDVLRQLPAWKKRNIADVSVGGGRENPGSAHDWIPANVRDIHLGLLQDGSMTPGGDRRTVVTFAAIAAMILGTAVFNFINLATARAGARAREVALRKVVGASRPQLIVQFLAEALLSTALAMMLGLALVELGLPWLNRFLGTAMTLSYVGPGGLLPGLVALLFGVALAAGLYPAFQLSRFQPSAVLKANKSAETPGSGRLRTALVLLQFAVAIGLMTCTAVIVAQIGFARTADPGYRRDGLLQIANLNRRALLPVADTLVQEIAKVDGVKAVARSTIGVATWGMDNLTVSGGRVADPVEFDLYRVDPEFFRTMGIATLAGRTFQTARAMDDSTVDIFADDPSPAQAALAKRGYGVVINAEAARRLGYARPADAVGAALKADDGDVEANGRTPVTVIGVVGDARLRSVRDPLEPMVFLYDRLQPGWLLIRYDGAPARVRAAVERVWRRIAPEAPFDAQFSDEVVRDLYAAEDARALIFAGFAGLAVVIACMGLFGLAAFTAERRTKEIGIRKVLGARVRDIVRLLAWQFSKPVVLANLVAWPVAWWAMRDWLDTFSARIALGPGPFVLAGLLALGIALVTVAGHAIRVARLNPIHALRYE